jgi:Domain of unknown function (DUF6815)
MKKVTSIRLRTGGSAGPQTEPRQWRRRRVEARAKPIPRRQCRWFGFCRRSAAACLWRCRSPNSCHGAEAYFANEGCIIDQPYQVRLPDGMIRCYMGADKVIGFGHQLIKALIPPPPEGPDSIAPQPGPRIMHPASAPEFQALRARMESDWTPQMMELLDIDAGSLPIIWDVDFLYGPRDASGQDTYVLCEINVSSVFPFPEQAPAEIARLAMARLQSKKRGTPEAPIGRATSSGRSH